MVFMKHNGHGALSMGLTQTIRLLASDSISDNAAEFRVNTWRKLINEHAKGNEDSALGLQVITAALEYRQTGDVSVLQQHPYAKVIEVLLGLRDWSSF
jgi:hypothetical protein